MILIPAIDLIDKNAVRLYKGDYSKKEVYSSLPLEVARSFKADGATDIHLVDLDGAKLGEPKNDDVIAEIVKHSGLSCEVGGGIRTLKAIEKYLSLGVKRVILGTVAVENAELRRAAVREFKNGISIGVDVKNGFVAIKGWTSESNRTLDEFMCELEADGVDNVICTDISKDGAMQGTNLPLYRELKEKYKIKITASGGVSSLDDVKKLNEIGVYGAILGKALYTGEIDLRTAIELIK